MKLKMSRKNIISVVLFLMLVSIFVVSGVISFNENNTLNDEINNMSVNSGSVEESLEYDSIIGDSGLFSDNYRMAYDTLKKMTIEEKIGQMLLVRYPSSNQQNLLEKYNFGGYVFYEKDFKDKTKEEVINMMSSLQKISKIPILTAVDEEGGSVVRVSSNSKLRTSVFQSSQELYKLGGMELIKKDTEEKSKFLKELGINVNLAPVIDVSTNQNDYMYQRTIGEDTLITSQYAKTVIEASIGLGVSYTLKHFPGYGNNVDTHVGTAVDSRSLSDINKNDLPPFIEGIEAGAEAILVSHNIVTAMDADNPASLSLPVHRILRDDLNFTGIIIADDLDMGAISSIDNAAVEAVKAGNDLIITTDYESDFNDINNAVLSNKITEEDIDRAVFRILAWKYYKNLLFINQK